MKSESSFAKIVWSLAYLFLVALALRAAIHSQPVRVEAAPQQSQRKSLEQAYSGNPQVRVTKLKIGSDIRRFNEEFDESDDWPRRLALEVENTAAQPITYLQINLNFPETKMSGNMMSYPIEFGARPSLGGSAAARKPLRLMPGEKLQIDFNDHYDELERFIRIRHTMNQISKAQVEIGFIIFEDGMAWAAGDFLRPDPNNPRHYISVGRTIPR
jgi:hypothetical protein